MKKIVIHYPFIAKYRIPIFTLLSKSEKFSYEFWASEVGSNKYLLTETKGLKVTNIPLQVIEIQLLNKKLEWQPSAIKHILKTNTDVYVVLGNPNSLSTWLCVLISKLRRIPVVMWSHGYLKDENGVRGAVRKLFYKLGTMHLLYGNQAKEIMLKKGFEESILHVIYNSLDYENQIKNREKLTYLDRLKIRSQYSFDEKSIVLIVIGRLETKLKVEQVIEAVSIATTRQLDINLFIVGDGSQKDSLKKEAIVKKVKERVVFYGACHDEEELSQLYNACDYSVVMGKVGLAAMHSLAYGVPMITNDNLDKHFPEIEAIIDGKTGFYFQEDNLDDFLDKINPIDYRGSIYAKCIETLEQNYTPSKQFYYIEEALESILGNKI